MAILLEQRAISQKQAIDGAAKHAQELRDALEAERIQHAREVCELADALEAERCRQDEAAEQLRVLQNIMDVRDERPTIDNVCQMIMDKRFADCALHCDGTGSSRLGRKSSNPPPKNRLQQPGRTMCFGSKHVDS